MHDIWIRWDVCRKERSGKTCINTCTHPRVFSQQSVSTYVTSSSQHSTERVVGGVLAVVVKFSGVFQIGNLVLVRARV